MLLYYRVQSAVFEGNNSYALAEYWYICTDPMSLTFNRGSLIWHMITLWWYYATCTYIDFHHVKQKYGSLVLFPSLLDGSFLTGGLYRPHQFHSKDIEIDYWDLTLVYHVIVSPRWVRTARWSSFPRMSWTRPTRTRNTTPQDSRLGHTHRIVTVEVTLCGEFDWLLQEGLAPYSNQELQKKKNQATKSSFVNSCLLYRNIYM